MSLAEAAAGAIDPRVLDEAADWLVRLGAGNATDADRAACECWRHGHPEHARAWARAERLVEKFGGLPAPLAMPALDRPDRGGGKEIATGRRAAIARAGKLALWLAAIPAGGLAWRIADESGWAADHRTAHGERRDLTLADGTRVTLNTASALDVRFDALQRLLLLRGGEVLVQSAPDRHAGGSTRPLRVATAQGRVEAIGTRFTVRQAQGRTHVAVLEGAVRLDARDAAPSILLAGQRTAFTATGIDAARPVDAADTAWTQGMLLADGIRLADFAAELARYRRGGVACDPAVADLRVSGAFPVGDAAGVDRTLAMLAATYPVRAQPRLAGWGLTLVPATR